MAGIIDHVIAALDGLDGNATRTEIEVQLAATGIGVESVGSVLTSLEQDGFVQRRLVPYARYWGLPAARGIGLEPYEYSLTDRGRARAATRD